VATALLPGPSRLPEDTLADVAAVAALVDCNDDADRRPLLARLGSLGVLDLGLPGVEGGHQDQVRVIAELASACMSSAFAVWAHRMTVEYLARFSGPRLSRLTEEVRRGIRPGSTALAAAFRAAQGLEELPVVLSRSGERMTASGFVSWASNLYDDAVVVTAVRDGDVRRIVVLPLSRPGLRVAPVSGLLALDASRSGSIRLENVDVEEDDILDVSFEEFVAHVRPVFLAFQSAFCLGLASAALAGSAEPRGVAVALAPRVSRLGGELDRLCADLGRLTSWLDERAGSSPVNPVRLRLDSGHLAVAATQLELAVLGGAAYTASSPTARRVREALFIPVQSPTEAQLEWELQHSA
jgi:alkylation response protein AidB-like acyl-CoA dehydrogenase